MVLLRHGDTENRYGGDGSRIIGAIVMDAVNRGLPREYVRRLLADPRHKGGFACLRRHRNDLDAWFDREWARAVAKVASSPAIGDRNEATLRAVELADHADHLEWRGVGGATDYAVYRHVLNVAAKAGRLGPLALAVRDVALGAGIEHYTAGRSLRRLVGRGLLRRTAAGRGKFAATYQVEAGRNRTTVSPTSEGTQVHHSGGRNRTTPSHTGPAGVGPVWCGNVRSDCWRWKGLGLTKARTWAHLSDEPVSTSDLADALGVEARTARRHLAALAKYDLAGHVDAQGWVRGPADPDEVAEEIGTADATERQRKRHAEDRQDRAEALAAYAAVAEEPPSYVDPETGEVIPTTDLRTASPSPKDETDAAIARLLAAFPGAEVVTIHEEVAA